MGLPSRVKNGNFRVIQHEEINAQTRELESLKRKINSISGEASVGQNAFWAGVSMFVGALASYSPASGYTKLGCLAIGAGFISAALGGILWHRHFVEMKTQKALICADIDGILGKPQQ